MKIKGQISSIREFTSELNQGTCDKGLTLGGKQCSAMQDVKPEGRFEQLLLSLELVVSLRSEPTCGLNK